MKTDIVLKNVELECHLDDENKIGFDGIDFYIQQHDEKLIFDRLDIDHLQIKLAELIKKHDALEMVKE